MCTITFKWLTDRPVWCIKMTVFWNRRAANISMFYISVCFPAHQAPSEKESTPYQRKQIFYLRVKPYWEEMKNKQFNRIIYSDLRNITCVHLISLAPIFLIRAYFPWNCVHLPVSNLRRSRSYGLIYLSHAIWNSTERYHILPYTALICIT